ncbi:retrotransposon gag domain, retroviral aspartyl protease [Tanacetum coccineum]
MHHLQCSLRIGKAKDKTVVIKGCVFGGMENFARYIDAITLYFSLILKFPNTSGTTMKVEGALEGRKVLILVDSGSTHNFISASLVKQLGLKVSMVPSFRVQIGNGQIIH